MRKDLAALTAPREDVRRYALALRERLIEVDAEAAAQTGERVGVLLPLGLSRVSESWRSPPESLLNRARALIRHC